MIGGIHRHVAQLIAPIRNYKPSRSMLQYTLSRSPILIAPFCSKAQAEQGEVAQQIQNVVEQAEGTITHVRQGDDRVTGEEAWQLMLEGNQRFSGGNVGEFAVGMAHKITPERRLALESIQTPIATVVTCADSRVSPELVFECGLGDLFVVRNGGNLLDDTSVASVEFSVTVANVPLLVVMGHQNCGALTACVEHTCESIPEYLTSEQKEHNSTPRKNETPMESLFRYLRLSAKSAHDELINKGNTKNGQVDRSELIATAIKHNVRVGVERLLRRSPAVADAARNGNLKIVGGVYSFSSGKIELVDIDDILQSNKH